MLQFWNWCGCHGYAFNCTLISASTDPEVTLLTPAGAPAVFNNPVIQPSFWISAIAHQQDSVIGQLKWIERVLQTSVVVDPLVVVEEVVIDFKSNCHGPMMNQLKLHQGFVAAPVETSHIVVFRCVVAKAVLLHFAWCVSACVGEARLFHQPEILGVLSCNEVWEATITA